MKKHWQGDTHRHKQLLIVASVIALLFVPRIRQAAWINLARVQMLHGSRSAQSWLNALALSPNDSRLRSLSVSAMLSEHADIQRVLDLTRTAPIAPDDELLNALFPTLYAQSRLSDILELHAKNAHHTHYSIQAAAALALALAQLESAPINADVQNLARALEIQPDTPVFALLNEKLSAPHFWQSQRGAHMRDLLASRAMPQQSQTADTPDTGAVLTQVAALLHLPENETSLGDELALNGNFEEHAFCTRDQSANECAIAGWSPSLMSTGYPWNRGVYVLGGDTHVPSADSRTMRIDGVIVEQKDTLEPARGGYWHLEIKLKSHTAYAISFRYRTSGVNRADAIGMWLTSQDNVIYQHERYFSPTDEAWRTVTLVGWNAQSQPAKIKPLLRLWGEGTLWIDDFSVREIQFTQPVKMSDTLVVIK